MYETFVLFVTGFSNFTQYLRKKMYEIFIFFYRQKLKFIILL